jgi:hypothetical protein
MKTACRLLIAGILVGGACNAQDLSKNSMEFSAGMGIPVGAFASKDPKSIKSGLAKNGLVMNLEYSHYFKAKIGWCAGLRRSVFPLDVDRLSYSNPNTMATSEPWRVLIVYAGLNSRKKFRDKIVLNYKAAVGLATSRYPSASINNSNVVVINFSSNTGSAFAFIVGASLKYLLSEKVQLALKLDYLSTSPKFVVTETVYNYGQTQKTYNSSYTQNIQAITAGASVSYHF